MKKNIILFAAAALMLTVTACEKSGDDDSGASNMELITSASWKYDNAMYDGNADGKPDSQLPPGILESCETDNIITLNDDGTGTVDEGPTKCDDADPQTVDITWEFSNASQTIINLPDTIYGSITGEAEIKILTETKLQLVKDIEVDMGIPVTFKVFVDFKH